MQFHYGINLMWTNWRNGGMAYLCWWYFRNPNSLGESWNSSSLLGILDCWVKYLRPTAISDWTVAWCWTKIETETNEILIKCWIRVIRNAIVSVQRAPYGAKLFFQLHGVLLLNYMFSRSQILKMASITSHHV